MKITRHPNGIFYARVLTAAGTRLISLKTRDEQEAHRLVRDSKLVELESAAKANALTAEAVSRIVTGRRTTGAEVLVAWREWAQMAGLAPNTIERYETYARLFLRQSGFTGRTVGGLSERHVDVFVNPPNSAITVATRRNRLAAVSSFFGYAHVKGLAIGNPAALVRVRLSGLTFEQKEPKRRVPFSEEEMNLLRSIEHLFWSTFVMLGEHYGLRLSDVAQLERACISKPGAIIIYTDKRDKRLELPLDPRVGEHLAALESTHASYFFPREQAIISDPNRRALLSVEFGRLVRRLGIHGKSAHCLRHTFASKRAGLGDTVDAIRTKLGHASSETTLGYIHAA